MTSDIIGSEVGGADAPDTALIERILDQRARWRAAVSAGERRGGGVGELGLNG